MATETREINGMDLADLQGKCDAARREPSSAQRRPRVVAEWIGGDQSRVTSGDNALDVNTPGTLGPMRLLLAALASCEVDVIATHASLLGLKIESLSVEAEGHFDVRSYLGVADTPAPGYDGLRYTIRLRAPGVSSEQIARLREAVEHRSPVGDSLRKPITISLDFVEEV